MTKYIVTGACVTHVPAAGPNGPLLVTLYQGAPLPEGVPEDRIEHLLAMNLIGKAGSDEVDEALAEAYAPNQQQSDPARQAGAEPNPDPDAPKPINGRSSKDDLVDYAVKAGRPREEAEGMTREQLLDEYVRKTGK